MTTPLLPHNFLEIGKFLQLNVEVSELTLLSALIRKGYYGGTGAFPFPTRTHIAVCTIEKGYCLVNSLIEEKRLDEIGLVVVDEVFLNTFRNVANLSVAHAGRRRKRANPGKYFE